MSSVEVQIELGHEANLRAIKTEKGYTHDWTVWVRGLEGCNIEHFIKQVIFTLHDSFDPPIRVFTKPPFEITESGYAGFMLLIEIQFKNKEEPRKVVYNYDLFLNLGGPAKSRQTEKLIFKNPGADFKKKLLKSGGHVIDKHPPVSIPNSGGHGEEHPKHSNLSSSSGKSSKPTLNNVKEKKSSKLTSAAPSKDKPLNSQHLSEKTLLSSSSISASQFLSSSQTTAASSSSSQPVHHSTHVDKTANYNAPFSQPLQDQFTDLFGIPIQARPSPDPLLSKTKDKSGLSSHKSSSKKISSNDTSKSFLSSGKSSDKEKKHKSSSLGSSDPKIEKDISSIKLSKPREESLLEHPSPKLKKDKSKSHSNKPPSGATPISSASYLEKKLSSKELGSAKKRKRSVSPSSLPQEKDDKDRDYSSKGASLSKESTDKTHKERSKKQRTSSKDVISTNAIAGSNSNQKVKDIKKESSTSTTISLTNNNNTGTTTLEIKSVKKEKTWDSEIKKSRNKEHKSSKEQSGKVDELKTSRENLSKASKVRDKEKEKTKDRETDRSREKVKGKSILESPKDSYSNKYLKVPKDKLHTPASIRDPSCSPASNISGSYTPGGIHAPSSASSMNCNISGLMAEMEQESLPVSPLSSCDSSSPLTFGHPDHPKGKDDSSDSEKDAPCETYRPHGQMGYKTGSRPTLSRYDDPIVNYNSHQEVKTEPNDTTDHRRPYMNSSSSLPRREHLNGPDDHYDPEYIEQLKVLYRKINELRDRDLLQKIVDIIEETGLFTVTNAAIDFDLMQLDRSTVKKIKLCLSRG